MRVLNFVIIAWHFVFGTHHILFLHTLVDLSCRLTCFSQQRKELGRQVTSKLTLEFLPSPSERAFLHKFLHPCVAGSCSVILMQGHRGLSRAWQGLYVENGRMPHVDPWYKCALVSCLNPPLTLFLSQKPSGMLFVWRDWASS